MHSDSLGLCKTIWEIKKGKVGILNFNLTIINIFLYNPIPPLLNEIYLSLKNHALLLKTKEISPFEFDSKLITRNGFKDALPYVLLLDK